MGRILAVDYGSKRIGIAVTDPMQIIANPLTTVKRNDIFSFLEEYFHKEKVDVLVLGHPKRADDSDSEIFTEIRAFATAVSRKHPGIKVEFEDERYTSSMALKAMIDAGAGKKQRRNKETIDMVSAAIILQSYLQRKEIQSEQSGS